MNLYGFALPIHCLKFVVTRFEKREEIEDRDREIWNKITRNSLKIVVTYVFFHGI